MSFKKYEGKSINNAEKLAKSNELKDKMKTRRSVRKFAKTQFPVEIIENIISMAASAPSGANKEPWFFSIIKNADVKKKIRKAAEKEEKKFYNFKAPEEWLNALKPLGTNHNKRYHIWCLAKWNFFGIPCSIGTETCDCRPDNKT